MFSCPYAYSRTSRFPFSISEGKLTPGVYLYKLKQIAEFRQVECLVRPLAGVFVLGSLSYLFGVLSRFTRT